MTPNDSNPPTAPGPAASPSGEFVVLMTSHQRMLHAYIVTILGSTHAAEDVLQSVNLKVWEKSAQFEHGTNFGAWVRTIAYHTVQEHWRKERNERNLEARLRLVNKVSRHFDQTQAEMEERQSALDYCLSLLPDHHRRWIESRYRDGKQVAAIAEEKKCSAASVAQALYRIRQQLKTCVKRRVAVAEKGARRDG